MLLIDKLCYTSKLVDKNPTLKCSFAVMTLIICICASNVFISATILVAMSCITVFGGGINFGQYFKLLRLPCAFLILSTVAIAVNIAEAPMSAFYFKIFGQYLTISSNSAFQAINLFSVALASVSCLYFMALSTPVNDIIHVLRICKVPAILIELMFLIYRFLFVLLQTSQSLYASQQARLSAMSFKTFLRASSQLMSALLVKAFLRTGRLYDAMEARCFDGCFKVIYDKKPVAKAELWGIIIFEIILIAGAIFTN